MKKLLLAFGLIISSLHAYSQNGYSSVFLRVTDSATFVNSANTTAKHAANYADIWYSTASGLFWKWSTVTNTYTLLGSAGWNNPGVTTLTGRTAILGSGNSRLHFGMDLSDVITPLDRFIAHADTMYLGTADNIIAFEGTDITVTNNTGSTGFNNIAGNFAATASADVDLHSTGGAVHMTTNSVSRLQINNNGSWTVGAAGTGTSGYLLASQGASSPPIWVAPSGGGGGATAAGATGNIQYKSAGGGLQAETALSYDSATNILDADIVTVNTEAYDATGWNGDLSVPTKDALRDKIQSLTNSLTQDTVLTSASTINLRMSAMDQKTFVGFASFATAKALTISDTTSNTQGIILHFEVTNVAATLTPKTNWYASDVNFASGVWTAPVIGRYILSANKDLTNNRWKFAIVGPFSR